MINDKTFFVDLDGTLSFFSFSSPHLWTTIKGDILLYKEGKKTIIADFFNDFIPRNSAKLYVLTNLADDEISEEVKIHKIEWVKKNIMCDYELIFNKPELKKCDNPRVKEIVKEIDCNSILIDDNADNLVDWRQSGGSAFHTSIFLLNDNLEFFKSFINSDLNKDLDFEIKENNDEKK